tara:strand:+ start:2118 stop:3458 length:1341 start_codon:yes stop_codon:yes gene_type:complete
MSPQHDYVIDNSTGANVRVDINSVLQAIASNNSGSSAPSTTYAFQLFADTTNNVMKIRNSNNTDFIELFQLDGTFTLEDGSNSSPALAFRDDLNTGIFSGADNEFNIATGGIERFVINSSGDCGIGLESPSAKLAVHTTTTTNSSSQLFRITTANGGLFGIETDETSSNPTWKIGGLVNSGAAEPLAFYQLGSEVARIDSSGRLLLGGASSSHASTNADDLQIGANNQSNQTGITLGSASGSSVRFADAGDDTAGAISYFHTDDAMRFFTNSSERVRISSSGAVSVGSTSNTFGGSVFAINGFYVSAFNGDNLITNASQGGGSAALFIGNAQIQVSSDERIKKDIVDTIVDATEQLKKIRIVDFIWNDPKDVSYNNKNARGKWTGALAQEMVKVFPHIINAPRKEDTLEIDYESERQWLVEYENLVPILIKSIQELSAKIEALEAA